MSKIKEFTAKVHLGILESSTLVLLILVGLLGWYEGYFLTEMTFIVYGKKPELPDYISNYAPVLMASLLTMCVPLFVQHSKSKYSFGGSEISPLELMLTICMVGGSMLVYGYIYLKTMESLDAVLSLKKMSQQAYNLRVSTFTMTIVVNLFIDFLLGMWSIYEVESHNDNLKTIKTGKYKKKQKVENKKNKEEEDRKKDELKKFKDEEDEEREKDKKEAEEAIAELKRLADEKKEKELKRQAELNLPALVTEKK